MSFLLVINSCGSGPSSPVKSIKKGLCPHNSSASYSSTMFWLRPFARKLYENFEVMPMSMFINTLLLLVLVRSILL